MNTSIQPRLRLLRVVAVILLPGFICACDAQTTSGRSSRFSLTDSVSVTTPPSPVSPGSIVSRLPLLSVHLIFAEPSGNGVLDADETGTVRIVVANKGKTPARKLQARVVQLTECRGLMFGAAPILDELPGDSTRTIELQITAGELVSTQQHRIRIEILEEKGFDLDPPVVFAFQTKQFSPPVLVVSDYAIDDQNRTGRIEPRDIIEITARIQNRGLSKAKDVTVAVSLGENISFEEGSEKDFSAGGHAVRGIQRYQVLVLRKQPCRVNAHQVPFQGSAWAV